MTSTIKVDNIQNQCGANIINESANTITIGASGDTVSLASGASQSGFGRTGTVDWETTPKTANFTAVNGEGYFCNTTSGAITMTMPSGSAGAIVSIQDYNNTFDSNALTVAPASGEKINGGPADGNLTISTEGQGITFVYVDSTVGWKTIHENAFTAGGEGFITATGGTITTSGNCKIHTFTGPGTFCVSAVATTAANNVVSYVVVAGGGGGSGGGGGAGGFREYKSPVTPYTASPLDGNPGGTEITVTATGFPIAVGGGGASGSNKGVNSTFSTVTSAGGGAGKGSSPTDSSGGSGGGGRGSFSGCSGPAGSGNTPPVSPPQGNSGGAGTGPDASNPLPNRRAGGGGGATAAGKAHCQPTPGGGGAGATTSITGTPTTYAGGGGGSQGPGAPSPGGAGGGGAGCGTAGTANTGGGGGGEAGGSGVVIIRYKFQ